MRSSIPSFLETHDDHQKWHETKTIGNRKRQKPKMIRPTGKTESVLVRAPEEADFVNTDNDTEVQSQHVKAAMSTALNQARSKDFIKSADQTAAGFPRALRPRVGWLTQKNPSSTRSMSPLALSIPLQARFGFVFGVGGFRW